MNDLVLERRRLLWRTRGQYWDYLFLLRPEQPVLPGWIQVFEQVFADDRAPSEGVFYTRSSLRLPGFGRRHSFVAAALTDPVRCDFVGRRIQHFFIYMLRDESDADQFHAGWAERLLGKLGGGISTIFNEKRAEEEDPEAFSGRLLRKLAGQLPEQIRLEQSPEPVKWVALPELVNWEAPAEDEKKHFGPPHTAAGPKVWWILALVLLGMLAYRAGCPRKEPGMPPGVELRAH